MRTDVMGRSIIQDEVRVFEIIPGKSIEEYIDEGDALEVEGRKEVVTARSIEVIETIEVTGGWMINRMYNALALQKECMASLISPLRRYRPSEWPSCYQMAVEAGLIKNGCQ
jgi:hypothetical protein